MGEFVYQKNRRFFAQTPNGCEEAAAKELADLGAEKIAPGVRGLYFFADRSVLYRINYKARLISHVLAPLFIFDCRNREDLYRAGSSIDWGSIFSVKNTLGIFSNVSGNDSITHSQFASQCLKDAVVDQFRKRSGSRPDVDLLHPDVWINLFIEKNRVIALLVQSLALAQSLDRANRHAQPASLASVCPDEDHKHQRCPRFPHDSFSLKTAK